MELSQGQIFQKPIMQELASLFMTHHLNVMQAPVKFNEYTVYYMELNQGLIIQKPKMQELSFMFITHHLNVMPAPVKFHKYIPYC